MRTVFVLIIFTILPAIHSWVINRLETKELYIGLDENGHLVQSSRIPKCTNGEIIILLSYNYVCVNQLLATKVTIHGKKQPFSPVEELQLHEMCSLKTVCTNLTFPLRNTAFSTHTANAIQIKYQCIDPSTNVIDICKDQRDSFNGIVHMTTNVKTMSRNSCQCMLKGDSFSLSLQDIRLKKRESGACSSVILQLNNLDYHCNDTAEDYGSIFGFTLNKPMSNAYISVRHSSINFDPEKVWITVTSNERFGVECLVTQTVESTEKLSSEKPEKVQTNIVHSELVTSNDIPVTPEQSETDASNYIKNTDSELVTRNDIPVTPEQSETDASNYTNNADLESVTSNDLPISVTSQQPDCIQQNKCCMDKCGECNGPALINCSQCIAGFEMRGGFCQKKPEIGIIVPVLIIMALIGVLVWALLAKHGHSYHTKTSTAAKYIYENNE